MEKVKKQEIISQIKELMDSTGAIYIIDFSGMKVSEVEDLRGEFYKANIKYKVVKNTLALRALKESANFSSFSEQFVKSLVGSSGIVFAGEDPIAPAKILKKFTAKSEKPKFKVAVVDNQFYGSDKLNELASLLSKEELIAGILLSIDSPVSGIVGAINAVIRDLSSVIEEAAKKRAA